MPPPYPVRLLADLPFAEPDGVRLLADLYLPEGAPRPLPVLLWLHGGGWRYGDRRLAPDLSRYFAQAGFAMLAIEYRLSTQALFPAQIQDVMSALRWTRAGAAQHGLDPERVGLIGSSAGGHLAALAALAPPGRFDPPGAAAAPPPGRVRAVVVGYAPTDFLQIDPHRPPEGTVSDDPEHLGLPRSIRSSAQAGSFESLLLGAPIETCPSRVQEANPAAYAAAGAPPFLILHGLSDTAVPPHQSELLYDALKAAGSAVTLGLIEGLGHGFLHRTHLDDGPPRRWRIRGHQPGRGERVGEADRPVFATIESFFRAHLGREERGASAGGTHEEPGCGTTGW